MKEDLIDKIDAALPQTQCEDCGYSGCRPYAEAMISGESIDLCAPGGQAVYDRLLTLLGRTGDTDKVLERYKEPTTAYIDQEACIGCMKCIRVCPTDAIIGMKKRNHFVVDVDCSGCGLCLPVCPVDCIDLQEEALSAEACLSLAGDYKRLFEEKKDRLALENKGLEERNRADLLSDMLAIRRKGRDE